MREKQPGLVKKSWLGDLWWRYGWQVSTVVLSIVVLTLPLVFVFVASWKAGVGLLGPERVQDVVIHRTYQQFKTRYVNDHPTSVPSGFYVETSGGVFSLGVSFYYKNWDLEDMRAKLQEGTAWRLKTRGNRHVSMWFRAYPYIVGMEPVPHSVPIQIEKEE